MDDRILVQVAHDTEDVAGGLRVFRDALSSDATHITHIISKLFAISHLLNSLDEASQHPQYRPSFYLIQNSMSVVIVSLRATQDTAFDMFGRTRSLSHVRVWNDFQHQMEDTEGVAFDERLDWYALILQSAIDTLRERPSRVNRQALCEQLAELLRTQKALAGSPRRQQPVNLQYRHVEPMSPTFSFDEGPRPAFPYAPDPPTSPTFTTTSSQTLDSSHTSFSGVLHSPSPSHWAQDVFNGTYPATPFRRGYDSWVDHPGEVCITDMAQT